MRDRCVRVFFVGLILALPLLIEATASDGSTRKPSDSTTSSEPARFSAGLRIDPNRSIFWVELTLIGGLGLAYLTRSSLLRGVKSAPIRVIEASEPRFVPSSHRAEDRTRGRAIRLTRWRLGYASKLG